MRKATIVLTAIVFALCMSMIPAASAPSSTLRAVIDMQVVYPGCPLTPPTTGELMNVSDATACWTGPVSGE